MLHDAVVHKKRRVKRGKKWVWVKPVYVKMFAHKLKDGTVIKTKGGTVGPKSLIGLGASHNEDL